jgi:Arc/MetJ-type ribon-helix-helix transcriptional regulator
MARHPERDRMRKQAVSITLEASDLAFIEQGVQHRIFQSRSHAMAWAVRLLRQHVAQIMRQQEEARRLEEAGRRTAPGNPAPPTRGPNQPGDNFGFPPR